MSSDRIIYTFTDEAPALATHSLLPIVQTFLGAAGVVVESRDISLSARILSAFKDRLPEAQRVPDCLGELAQLVQQPEANIIKLPNISASVPQLESAIAELQAKGFDLPPYPDDPKGPEEKENSLRYDRVKGSAANPVLREGNSDRRAPRAVKAYARKHPHSMGAWSKTSKTHVVTMTEGDFFHNERSVTLAAKDCVRIEHIAPDGNKTILKESLAVLEGEVIDATVMEKRALVAFLKREIQAAKDEGVLFSVHLKATMMKVSDPVMFGHVVRTYFQELFVKYKAEFDQVGVDANNGLGQVLEAIEDLPADVRKEIKADIKARLDQGPAIAMVDSDRGITNLHVPSDVIVDASMPAMIRNSGKMWNSAGKLQDTKAVIPDSSYACLYSATVDFCREHGAFDPRTMGTVPNVGLMAQKAEEYGSHDTTFELAAAGKVCVVGQDGSVLLEHAVEAGDIWRLCQAKDEPIQDWIKLALSRARISGMPAIFWLDEARAHDAELIKKVRRSLEQQDTSGLQIEIMSPLEATRFTLARAKAGQDTISVTGNVLRDYLTDLFPILELGTSAKMLSIVPLMKGGGLFETGAGGSAPKHVAQFVAENHLRWDSLGEFLALGASLEHLAEKTKNPRATVLSKTLDQATEELLDQGKSPSRKCGEIDNRGSHFYLSLYWAQALARQTEDAELASKFVHLAQVLADNEQTIMQELNSVQGRPVDMGGYYAPNFEATDAAMRPCSLFNQALADH